MSNSLCKKATNRAKFFNEVLKTLADQIDMEDWKRIKGGNGGVDQTT